MAEELTAEGWQLWQRQKFAAARESFEEAVELDPEASNAWNGLGWASFNGGDFETGLSAFEKCVELEPEHPAAPDLTVEDVPADLSGGTALQANYGYRFWRNDSVALFAEVHGLANGQRKIDSANPTVTRDLATAYITPGIRVKFAPDAPVAPYFAIGGGFLEVQPDHVTILADSAEQADEIDVERAEQARQRAEEVMRTGVKDDPDRIAAVRASLLKAQIRVDVGRRRRHRAAALGGGRREDQDETR